MRFSSLTESRLIREACRSRLPGRALDVGFGYGQDSISLAKLGFQVDAIDIDYDACERFKTKASRFGIKVWNSDILNYVTSNCYDILVARHVDHLFDDDELPNFLDSCDQLMASPSLLIMALVNPTDARLNLVNDHYESRKLVCYGMDRVSLASGQLTTVIQMAFDLKKCYP